VTRTLVLLHGVASNSTRWSEFAARTRLKESWKILCPDLRGNGAAAFPRRRAGMHEWCSDLVAVLDAERCERAVVGGHCLGANIALQLASRHPARVAGLVLVEPMPREALAGTMRRLAPLRPLLLAAAAAIGAVNSLGLYRRRLMPLDLEALDRATRKGEAELSSYASPHLDLKTTPSAAYLRMLAATAQPWPDIASIRAPVLALISSRSTFADAARTRRALAVLPDCEIAGLEALHWIPTEQPEAMREAIEGWIVRHFP
jgi:pimeloyl-ACP methyl ester carboxylesterase